MAVYKPKKKTGTNTFEDIKIPASCIDGLSSGGGTDVTDYSDSIFYLYDGYRDEDERWVDGDYRFGVASGQIIKVWSMGSSYTIQHDRNNPMTNPTIIHFTRIKSGGCRFYYLYSDTAAKTHIVTGVAYNTMGDLDSYTDTIIGESSSSGRTEFLKVSYNSLPYGFSGNFRINPTHLISSDYPVVFFDGIYIESSAGFTAYASKDQIFNVTNGSRVLNATPLQISRNFTSITNNSSSLNDYTINLKVTTNGVGTLTISLIGHVAKSFTEHSPSGSIGY